MSTSLKMSDLQPGEAAVVSHYVQGSQQAGRLRELGLVEGAPFRVVRFAPLGDPMEIKVRGFYLSIGRSLAGEISVQTGFNKK